MHRNIFSYTNKAHQAVFRPIKNINAHHNKKSIKRLIILSNENSVDTDLLSASVVGHLCAR